jgi:hypothetical protein
MGELLLIVWLVLASFGCPIFLIALWVRVARLERKIG